MKTKTCKIEECEKPSREKGLCWTHYCRVRHGIKDMRPGRLPWKLDDPRYKNKNRVCDVPGCDKPFYAKGLCRIHYDLKRRHGRVIYKKDIPKPKCSVDGCDKVATSLTSGFCRFHYVRYMNGTPLHKPKGIKGPLNRHWKGGISEYPNHYEMKKIRLIVLEEANYICHYCGKPANQIHHKDLSKDNHSKENLVACCKSCNIQSERTKIYTSKYRRLYGKSLKELADKLKVSMSSIRDRHKQGRLTAYIRKDIQYYLSALTF